MDGDDTIGGGPGNDNIQGHGGTDVLFGDAGNDLLFGGAGDDTITGNDGDDRIRWDHNSGSDVVNGLGGVDTLIIDGTTNADTIRVTPSGARVNVLREGIFTTQDLGTVERLEIRARAAATTPSCCTRTWMAFCRASRWPSAPATISSSRRRPHPLP